ncbi:trypsin-like peptidase domain-containing protein [Aminobacter sp. P9b]
MASIARAALAALIILTTANALAEEPKPSGTGFAVTSDGWLLTNAHVVEGCQRIEVKGVGDASDPRIDATHNLALLKVTAKAPLSPLTFRGAPTRLGEDIVAIGFPLAGLLSDSIKVTTGNVNALAGLHNDTRHLQISTPIQPGNSGGPVIDRDGYLLGITTATLSKEAADRIGIPAQNVNFAIRASVADLFMQSQSIAKQSGDKSADQSPPSTADLMDRIAPSVFQVFCNGKPELRVDTPPKDRVADRPGNATSHILLDARGYDAIGFDYTTVRDVTYQGCRACEGDGQCKAITYNAKRHVCFLKDNVVALIRNSDAMAAYLSSKAADVIMSDYTSYSGMDLPGGDYKRIRQTNYLECFVSCIGDKACRAVCICFKKRVLA